MNKRLLIILIIFPLILGCSLNENYYKNRLKKIVDQECLRSQAIGHLSLKDLEHLKKINPSEITNNLDLYSDAIDEFIVNNCEQGKEYQIRQLTKLIVNSNKEFPELVKEKIEKTFFYLQNYDKKHDSFQECLHFIAILGNEKIKNKKIIAYCLDKLLEGKKEYHGNKYGYQLYAYIHHLTLMCKEDKEVMKQLKNILEQKEFFNDSGIKKRYDRIFNSQSAK